ncbi:MAG: thioredoxin domain-containing protein [Nannocystaceae bacterium]
MPDLKENRREDADAPTATSGPDVPPSESAGKQWWLSAPYLLICVAVAGLGFWSGPKLARWYRYTPPVIQTGERYKVALRGDEPQLGPNDAPVTVIEFSDFECPFCSRASEPLLEAIGDHAADVRLIFKHFPLYGHRRATPAAHAAWAAMQQGRFWEMHDWLYKKRAELDGLPAEVKRLGMDGEPFGAQMESDEAAADIDNDRLAAGLIGVTSTPSFFVNGHAYRGVISRRGWNDIFEAELARASALIGAGTARGDVYGQLMADANDRRNVSSIAGTPRDKTGTP